MNEQAVAALAEILDMPPGEARAVIKALRERGFRLRWKRPVDNSCWSDDFGPEDAYGMGARIDGYLARSEPKTTNND